MKEPDGSPYTAHTNGPVPFIAVGCGKAVQDGGSLRDIAPTILELLYLEKPEEMTGTSLLV
ncbi:2,3-bisphosphoglycerate-independent phosphoglycerate mutase [bioreactor metagenome]|uniref:2,3-bisphosphoglycerate-independent phosphoglycerate mutase n=1 Tax=bioreactor metagenome TaxID=1076179 RepID=A0A645JMB3_9ZZZZ